MASVDPEILAHLEWLGFVQPTGLVVSPPALVRAGAILDRRDTTGQQLLRASLAPGFPDDDPVIEDFETFARTVLGWTFSAKGYAGTAEAQVPEELRVVLPDYGETLAPDFAVRELSPAKGAPAWQLLVTVLEPGTDIDAIGSGHGRLEASPHGRMERLLRETGVAAGLLFNGRALRLVSAPRGESSGWLQFDVASMTQTAGRPICTAMRLLLGQHRLLLLPSDKRLAALLEDSRKFQNEVSEKLAEQVLHALYELLRGFQGANDASGGELLREPLANDPDDVYRGLLTVVLRLVFLLYAEEREMLPTGDETFARAYSLAGLFAKLRDHAAQNPDTMDQRYGAWAQLLVLFRMIHDGAAAGDVRVPPRHGGLFDPDRYPFLEGRAAARARQIHERLEPPRVPDGTIFRALDKLLVLSGERLSYRALDVEQIGSVYQTMMGFRLERTTGCSLAVRAKERTGAPTAVDLDQLLATEPGARAKWLKGAADRDLPPKIAAAVTDATSIDDLHSALGAIVDRNASPDLFPQNAMVLQPSDERRRSGSHYTPRALTEPIVRAALAPVLDGLRRDGAPPVPEAILGLKVCDPAMGSAAFLVESCRQLADALVESWRVHGGRPEIPADEDEVIHARRLVAQRCLYGLDRNEVAVDLAKMSLWLATLARDHPLTFLDHALRHGDSLVGLSRRQIQAFHWDDTRPPLPPVRIVERMERVSEWRAKIRDAPEATSDAEMRRMWDEAQAELSTVRLYGDLVLLAYFSADKTKARGTKRDALADIVARGDAETLRGLVEEAREWAAPLMPFHWQIEFPEVFERDNPGFDAIVGNPPFYAGAWIKGLLGPTYRQYIVAHVAGSKTGLRGTADLCVYFMLRSAHLVRNKSGTVGLILSSTVGEGDSKEVGTEQLAGYGFTIYQVVPKFKWPGTASVEVVMIWFTAEPYTGVRLIADEEVAAIYADLTSREGQREFMKLDANDGLICKGHELQGNGFKLTDEAAAKLLASPTEEAVIRPLIVGDDMNASATLTPTCYVINLSDLTLDEAAEYPASLRVVEEHVKPERDAYTGDTGREKYLRTYWWKFRGYRRELADFAQTHSRFLACTVVSKYLSFVFVPAKWIATPSMYCFLLDEYRHFAVLQSRVHLTWARTNGSTLGETFRYIAGRCFDTFPFPDLADDSTLVEGAGRIYYESRANAMAKAGLGLTELYNRVNSPDDVDPEIVALRELHDAMDDAVLAAYGWTDLTVKSEFKSLPTDARSATESNYGWSSSTQEAVLARLADLNLKRAEAERRAGPTATTTRKRRTRSVGALMQEELFE